MKTSGEDPRVLLVEEPDGRDVLKARLEMAGYRVDLADDGEVGLLMAAARAPAAALIDLDVPIVDGWSLAETLRQVFDQEIRLIAMAGEDAPEAWSFDAGFDTHLVKPVSPNRVRHALQQLLSTST
jgi:two-component system cell cycle response regulator DivK